MLLIFLPRKFAKSFNPLFGELGQENPKMKRPCIPKFRKRFGKDGACFSIFSGSFAHGPFLGSVQGSRIQVRRRMRLLRSDDLGFVF